MEVAIKHLSQLLVKEVGGIEAAAALCRLNRSRIHQCLSSNHPEDFLPIDVICALEQHVEAPYFAKLLGKGSAENSGPTNDKRMTSQFVHLSGFFGRVMEEYGASLEDDDAISAGEAKVILKQALDLQRSILNIEGNLLRIISGSDQA